MTYRCSADGQRTNPGSLSVKLHRGITYPIRGLTAQDLLLWEEACAQQGSVYQLGNDKVNINDTIGLLSYEIAAYQ